MIRAESYYVVSNPLVEENELQVLFAGHSQTKPAHKNGPKVFDYYLIHYIHSGQGTFTSLGQDYLLGAGDSFFIKPGKLVAYVADVHEPWHYSWIACKGKAVLRFFDTLGMTSSKPVISAADNLSIPELFVHLQNTLKSHSDSLNLKANGYMHLLVAQYCDLVSPHTVNMPEAMDDMDRTVQLAVQYLTTQYAESITIEMMAESLGYNRAYLSRIFKSAMQQSPVTFLLHLRLDKARRLIRERMELTLEQIASSVGFNDPLYFSKQFRRIYRITPSEYRRQMETLQEE